MKRKLFTFALLTTVVAGGATLSVNADTLYLPNSETSFECSEIPTATCQVESSSEFLWTGPGSTGIEVRAEDYNFDN